MDLDYIKNPFYEKGQNKMTIQLRGFIEFFKGKKTYVIALLMILLGWLNNDQKLILEGLGLMALRAGIAKQ